MSFLYIFLAFVAASALASVRNWRLGPFLMIAVVMLQDPIRKITPGTPGYLAMACVPVWIGMLAGAVQSGDLTVAWVRACYPRLARVGLIYAAYLALPAAISATYAPGAWQITALGLFTHFSLLSAVVLGMAFPRSGRDLHRLLAWYCMLVAVAVIGGPLERLGIGLAQGLTGTWTLNAYWVTHRTGKAIVMTAGFFRSPDVMGWHAATLVMAGLTLALASRGVGRLGWAALAGWGGVGIMFCARRKMISMIPPFVLVLLVLYVLSGHWRRGRAVVVTTAVVLLVGFFAYVKLGTDPEIEKFYGTSVPEMGERLRAHGWDSVVGTIGQAGFFGYGLGMAAQGVHHIAIARPNVWQESAPSMLMAEVGVPGFVLFLAMVAAYAAAARLALRRGATAPEHALFFGIAALAAANGFAGLVSGQIFGDPFVGIFLPFLMGVLLSAGRIEPGDDAAAAGRLEPEESP